MVFKLSTLLELVEKIHPVHSGEFRRIFDALGTAVEQQSIERVYEDLQPINFSREIIERIAERSPAFALGLTCAPSLLERRRIAGSYTALDKPREGMSESPVLDCSDPA